MDSKQKGDTETFPNPYLVYHVFVYYLRVGEGGVGGEKDQSQLRGAEVIGSAWQTPAVTVE